MKQGSGEHKAIAKTRQWQSQDSASGEDKTAVRTRLCQRQNNVEDKAVPETMWWQSQGNGEHKAAVENSRKSVRWSAVPVTCLSRLCWKLRGGAGQRPSVEAQIP